jgi:hypothetical protein
MTKLKIPASRVVPSRDCKRFCTAIAVSGVSGDGFHTTQSPHTAAISAFHDQTATGKLNAEMTPDDAERMPLLVHPMHGALAVHRLPVQLARQADAKSAMSIISCTSPTPSCRIFPISMDTRAPSSFFTARSSSPISRTSNPRFGAGNHSPALECSNGVMDHFVVIFLGRHLYFGDDVTFRRIVRSDPLARGLLDPRPYDAPELSGRMP